MKQLVEWSQTKGRPKRGRRQPCVELLESRRLLSSITEYPVALVNGKNTSPSEVTVGTERYPLVHRVGGNAIGRSARPIPTPPPPRTPGFALRLSSYGNHARARRQHDLVHRACRQPDRDDQPERRQPYHPELRYFRRNDGEVLAQRVSHPPTAISGSRRTRRTRSAGSIRAPERSQSIPAPVAMTTLNSRIVLGPDGNLWFTEFGTIGIFNPNTGKVVKEVPLASSSEEPFGIAVGPDGNIWYTEGVVNSAFTGYVSFGVGVISTDAKSLIKEIPVTASSEPFGITAGPDGNIWFAVTGANKVAGTIDVINPSTVSIIRTLAIPTNVVSTPDPVAITAGPDGNFWFSDGYRSDRRRGRHASRGDGPAAIRPQRQQPIWHYGHD